ncbi:pentatricopeptide repeat-containing protein At5g50280, chloroplastic [Cynara cardunculus var. scolymus]|uniref:Pentatricopeptide repeat-containing protein n=1 Tax=Cynara cardunculus var. scolymus TaxID=59895 RepID=A0A118K3N0_CYNCS|nr:pentatricopeptide repeat-containing protein At5g50280, chloroplastic [Cynara cardunculus var. scolymus]XP_024969432.1 pentatricopeptide repeat-containing protein At5g50280, chloroplastic [Cynara cardunculus var. scolymus]KVI06258.1 Pentatricopeptide repeat-containing protein [Cynara cardunculus var. scolymus]
MAVSLNHHSLSLTFLNLSSYSSRFHLHHHNHGTSLTKLRTCIPLSAISPPNRNPSSPTPLSSPSIFLPFLQEHEETISDLETPQIELPKDESITDPIHKFFKAQTSSQLPDPALEGKFTLQKNRRTSWHLSTTITNTEPEESGYETESNTEEQGTPVINIAEPETGSEEIGGSVIEVSSTSNGVTGVLEIARNLPENVTLGEVLGPYEGKLSARDCVEVLGLMGQEEGLTMCCLYFFEWMSLQEPSLVTPWAYSALFPVLGRARMGDKLMILFNNLPNSMEFKQVHVYNSAISALSYCGRYDDAWRLFEMMEEQNVEPDNVTCSIMITVMRKTGNSAKEAWEFFETLNVRGLKWSLEVMGSLIKSFCDEGLKKEALIIQLEMEKKGIASNAIVYNTIMNAYSKSDQIEEAEGLFAEMKAKGIEPTTASYNILMDAYSRRMQPEVIEKLMAEMEEIGLPTDVKSFTCLISAYGRQKKMSDMAADAFLKMKKSGIKPTSHSYTALIHAYSISGWHEKAELAFQNMKRDGVKPSIETYTALLDAFRRAGDTESLTRTWKTMMNDKVKGTRVTFNILVDGFAKQGQYSDARDVICEFGKIGLKPTVMTYNMLINAYARGGNESKLPQLLKEMAVLELKPDSVTYSTMIYAYVRVRDFKRAFYYHKEMVKSGQVPDARSYHKLRAILDVKAATKNKKDKSAIMGIISNKLGWVKIKKKGKKDEFWKNKKKWSGARSSDFVGRR